MKALVFIYTGGGGGIDPAKGWALLFTVTLLSILWVAIAAVVAYKKGELKKDLYDGAFYFHLSLYGFGFVLLIWILIALQTFFMQFTQ